MQRLYQIVTDFEKAPKYFPLVAQSMRITHRRGNFLKIEAVPKTFGIPFKVEMETQLLPNQGFISKNTSIVAFENESFLMEEVANGTKITYRNEVTIKNNFLQVFAKLLIGKPALMFWKFAYIDRLRS